MSKNTLFGREKHNDVQILIGFVLDKQRAPGESAWVMSCRQQNLIMREAETILRDFVDLKGAISYGTREKHRKHVLYDMNMNRLRLDALL